MPGFVLDAKAIRKVLNGDAQGKRIKLITERKVHFCC